MTESTLFETRLADALGRYADLAPVQVDEREILTTVAGIPASGWRWRVPAIRPRLVPRLLLVGLLLAALVAAALVGAGALTRSEPTGVADRFAVPFEYALPADTPLRLTNGPNRAIVGWSAGTEDSSGLSTGPDGRQIPKTWETHGVLIGLGEGVWGHGASSRYELQHEPMAFIADLRDVSHIRMTEAVETELGGWPAAAVTLMGGFGNAGNDIHLPPSASASQSGYLLLSLPSRLIVAEIDGITVYVLIWARGPDALDAWMPDAERFVESITFLPR